MGETYLSQLQGKDKSEMTLSQKQELEYRIFILQQLALLLEGVKDISELKDAADHRAAVKRFSYWLCSKSNENLSEGEAVFYMEKDALKQRDKLTDFCSRALEAGLFTVCDEKQYRREISKTLISAITLWKEYRNTIAPLP